MITNLNSSIFRKMGYQEWLITAYFKKKSKLKGNLESEYRSFKFGNMPMLARGRIYNTTEQVFTNKSKQAKFTLRNLDDLAVSDKNHFVYIVDIIHQNKVVKDVKIKLPKLELARVLFFENSYLASSALKERILDLDFSIRQVDDRNIITVLPHCSLNKTLFNDIGFRSKLSWLLLNSNIKNSYYSIYQSLVLNMTTDGKFENWIFDFAPPSLTDLDIETKGYLRNRETLYVDEIQSIKGINPDIIGAITFEGNIFTQEISVRGEAEDSIKANDFKEPSISDEHDANCDLGLKIIEAPKTTFEFLTPIISSIHSSKTVIKPNVKLECDDKNNESVEPVIVATNEATITGQVSKGEFENTEDTTERDVQYRQNFEGLIASIEKLNLIDIKYEYRELPKVKRCKLDKKVDGNKRVLLEVKFSYENQSFIVYEIDTTDLEKKRLSTLIVIDGHLVTSYDSLLEEIVRTSITWPKMPFTMKVNLNHPKDFYKGVADTETMIKGWSIRIQQALDKLKEL